MIQQNEKRSNLKRTHSRVNLFSNLLNTTNVMTDEQIKQHAIMIAKLKTGFDFEEESYFNKQAILIMEANIEGATWMQSQPNPTVEKLKELINHIEDDIHSGMNFEQSIILLGSIINKLNKIIES